MRRYENLSLHYQPIPESFWLATSNHRIVLDSEKRVIVRLIRKNKRLETCDNHLEEQINSGMVCRTSIADGTNR